MQNSLLLGAHISTAGGLDKAAERALSIDATTMQIFTKSNRSWFDNALTHDQITAFKQSITQSGLQSVVTHAAYLINIGSNNPATANTSVASLTQELERCQQLGIPYLVLHPGSHTGAGEVTCIKQIGANLDRVFEKADGTTMILLETMAGQGTNVGYSFEHLRDIIDNCKTKNLVATCLDTCHIFSAGYDISTPESYEQVITQFDTIIGLERLRCIHLNDSKTPFASRKDRHEELGKGSIPLARCNQIVHDKRFASVPKILETPTDPAMDLYRREIALLKSNLS